MAARHRRFVATGWLTVAVQGAFLGLLYAGGRTTHLPGEGGLTTLALLVMVGVPSVLWTVFFYAQDARAPEPSGYVAVAFLAGMAAAGVLALPIERDLFQTARWMYDSLPLLVAGATFVRGALVSFLIYLIIRYGFVPLADFDEPVDGLVYGAAAGSGFAMITSLTSLIGHVDFTLFAVGSIASANMLTYASVGALVGYLVGRTKFRFGHGAHSHLLALAVGALLTGLYHAASEVALLAGWEHAIIASVVATVVIAAGTLVLAGMAMREAPATPVHHAGAGARRGDVVVWAFAAVLLGVGGAVAAAASGTEHVTSREYRVELTYPRAAVRPRVLTGAVADTRGMATIFAATARDQPGSTVSLSARAERAAIENLDPAAYLVSARVLDVALEDTAVAGRRAMRARYAYLEQPEPGAGALPALLWAETVIVPGPRHTHVFTATAEPSGFPAVTRVQTQILGSVRWLD